MSESGRYGLLHCARTSASTNLLQGGCRGHGSLVPGLLHYGIPCPRRTS